jgi:hypothetical protein
MRIFMFSSQAKPELHAFAGDETGTRLPEKFGPWGLTGAIGPRAAPPHNFARHTIEQAIMKEGFQLWRTRAKG